MEIALCHISYLTLVSETSLFHNYEMALSKALPVYVKTF